MFIYICKIYIISIHKYSALLVQSTRQQSGNVTRRTEWGIIRADREKRTDNSVQCNPGDSNDDRNSSFAPLIIHGIALANVPGCCVSPHTCTRTHAYRRTQWLSSLRAVTRTWVVHGYVRKWAPVEDRSTSVHEYMYGKEKSSITFEAIRSWQWWTDDVLGIVSLWTRAS